VFLPFFAKSGEGKLTKTMCGIRVSFQPRSSGPLEGYGQKFLQPSSIQMNSVSKEILVKRLSATLQYRCEASFTLTDDTNAYSANFKNIWG